MGSAIKRTEVKRKCSFGPGNQVFSPREKPLDNASDFFAFCLSRIISIACWRISPHQSPIRI